MTGTVEALFVAREGSAPMERVESVEAVSGGLAGDRYQRGTGHYAPFDVCEVTLIAAEDLEAIREEAGIDLGGGQHRRNLVVRGVDLEELLGATVAVGEARLRGTRRRPPCAHVERVAEEKGLARALRGRGGICADVVSGGELRVGDPIEVVETDPRTVGREIAERLGGRE
jgi:MOSC domain-containing protein YiiM